MEKHLEWNKHTSKLQLSVNTCMTGLPGKEKNKFGSPNGIWAAGGNHPEPAALCFTPLKQLRSQQTCQQTKLEVRWFRLASSHLIRLSIQGGLW